MTAKSLDSSEPDSADTGRPMSFAVKAVVVTAAIILALIATANAAANIVERANPHMALAIWPGHSAALARATDMASLQEQVQPGANRSRTAVALARRSINASAIAPSGYRTLALAEREAGNKPAAMALLATAFQQSRRDQTTLLALMIDGIERSDQLAVLRYIDILFRTSVDMRAQAAPALSAVFSDPAIAPGLVKLIEDDPDWFIPYLATGIEQVRDPAPLAAAVLAADGLGRRPMTDLAHIQLARRLTVTGAVDTARRILDYVPMDRRPRMASLAINAVDGTGPFAWKAMATAETSGTIEPANGAMLFDVGPERRVELARKLATLAPGRYRITARVERDVDVRGVTLPLGMACLTNSAANQVADPAPLNGLSGTIGFDIVISQDCPSQLFSLYAAQPGRSGRFSLAIDRIVATRQ